MKAYNYNIRYRVALLVLLFAIAFLGLLMRLYHLQVSYSHVYQTLGQEQYEVTLRSLPPRAPLYDRHGTPLAINRYVVSACIWPHKLRDPAKVTRFVATHYPHAYAKLAQNYNHSCFFLQRNLTQDQIAAIENSECAHDIHLLYESGRYYPLGAAATLIGFTDSDTRGICGLELYFNDQLAGTPAMQRVWKDGRGTRYHTLQDITHNGQGTPVITSIDGHLQFLAEKELVATMQHYRAKEGSVLIINPATGEVLTMVNQPSYDPNDRTHLNLDSVNNRAVTHMYELGSVIKVCAALAALEADVVAIDELIDCENTQTTFINGRRVNTPRKTEAGVITFSRVIEKSNNIGIAKVALRLGKELYTHYQRMGFDTPTGIEFPGERSGFINPPSAWSKQSVISLSYGYEISITLVQLARFFCMIALDGKDTKLTLLKRDAPYEGKTLYSRDKVQLVKTILENTTLHGTTQRARIKGYTIMSKSGTANTIVNGQYTTQRGIFTCAGIIQKDDYQRVVVVCVKDAEEPDLFASTVAAPLFERIAQTVLIRDKKIDAIPA